MTQKMNPVGWFEIPVSDMDRAIRFYEDVFQFKLSRNQMGPLDMAWFPGFEAQNVPGSGGSLVHHEEFYKPSVRWNPGLFHKPFGRFSRNELSRVQKAGGQVLVPKRLIAPDIGYMGVFMDTEGNRVALHSRK
jgi:uncharacterized protein